MPLSHIRDLLVKALKGRYAIAAFNVCNLELLQAVVEAGEEEKAPLVLQITRHSREYANLVYLKKLIEAAISVTNIPIAVHVAYGDTFDLCKQYVDEGFTSIMIDAWHLPFEKSVELTKKVVEYAHKHNAVVEATFFGPGCTTDSTETIGIGKGEFRTDPEQAAEFVKLTGADLLVVDIFSRQGVPGCRGKKRLDLNQLDAIRAALARAGLTDYPLVVRCCPIASKDLVGEINLYGGKVPEIPGVLESELGNALRGGIVKVTIDTDLQLAMTAGIRKALVEHPEEFNPTNYLAEARARVKEVVRRTLRHVVGCAGHAFD